MADLEYYGYIDHPHTSAGRMPTDKGYRLYVNDLMARERLTDAERKAVEDAVAALREAMSGEDIARLRERMDALAQAMTRFVEAIRRGAAATQTADRAAAGDKPSGAGGEGVVDAEFEEVDGDKKKQGHG